MPNYTTQQVADMLGLTDGRIRQLAIRHNIGSKFGRARLFTEKDVAKLKAAKLEPGRPKRKVTD